jgi:drug/metabolite transporter (DMT)-like permease
MSNVNQNDQAPPRGLLIAAFAAVYVTWGSTYLAIRFAVETVPPFLMGGGRFLVAGLLLYGWLRLRGAAIPSGSHWRNAAVAGALLLGIGNGGVNWAEQKVPSGVTALIIAVTPLWFALLDWLRPNGPRPKLQTVVGIVVGFCGMALLVGSRNSAHQAEIDAGGVMALMLASFAWAAGSLYARYTPQPEFPLLGVALQMIVGGLLLFLVGAMAGEFTILDWSRISPRSGAAFFYLIVVGSFIGFTAYSWLLKVSTPARVSTYAYVNPVVAVILGWAFAGETLTPRTVWAAAVILLGVVIITTRRDGQAKRTDKSAAS